MAYLLWAGPSAYNGEQIMVGVSFDSKNRKTGPLAGITVVPMNAKPTMALKNFARKIDKIQSAVCTTCPLQGGNGCYVNTMTVNHVWTSLHKRLAADEYYPVALLAAHDVRFGVWGDCAVVPYDVLAPAIESLGGAVKVGYTHAWAESWIDPRWKKVLMASVETDEQEERAIAAGWTPYRIMPEGTKARNNAVHCPHDVMANNGNRRPVQCIDCGLCGPKNIGRKARTVWTEFKATVASKSLKVSLERDAMRDDT